MYFFDAIKYFIIFVKNKRRVAPPYLFSQRNNPYCDLLENYGANIALVYKITK